MRYTLVLLAAVGMVVSALALREHYRTEASPCSINDKWDCGIVNKSEYAVFLGVPVAAVGIAGYVLIGALAFHGGAFPLLSWAVGFGLGFSLYLTHIEAYILEVWCLYCVASLGAISLMTLVVLGTVIRRQLEAAAKVT
jgi:uncharacterized membrane protein